MAGHLRDLIMCICKVAALQGASAGMQIAHKCYLFIVPHMCFPFVPNLQIVGAKKVFVITLEARRYFFLNCECSSASNSGCSYVASMPRDLILYFS